MAKKAKDKKCRVCTFRFNPRSSTQVVCSPACALALTHINKRKSYDRETKQRKAAIKSRAEWLKEAQTAFNAYIRERDKDFPCICCNKHYTGQYHAGHYLSVGAHPELRFNLWNVHKQKSSCNNFKSGNQAQYRIYLIKKIGVDKVEWLEGKHDAKKYTIEDIKRIKSIFTRKLKRIKSNASI